MTGYLPTEDGIIKARSIGDKGKRCLLFALCGTLVGWFAPVEEEGGVGRIKRQVIKFIAAQLIK